jgi:hypothetical protein
MMWTIQRLVERLMGACARQCWLWGHMWAWDPDNSFPVEAPDLLVEQCQTCRRTRERRIESDHGCGRTG